MSYRAKHLFVAKDFSGDSLLVETSESCPKDELFFNPSTVNGVFLSTAQIKELRKVLKQWLLDNGHKKSKPWA